MGNIGSRKVQTMVDKKWIAPAAGILFSLIPAGHLGARIVAVVPPEPVSGPNVYLYDFDGEGAIGTSSGVTEALRLFYYDDLPFWEEWRMMYHAWDASQQIVGKTAGSDVVVTKLNVDTPINNTASWMSHQLVFERRDWSTGQRGYVGFRISFDQGINYRFGWADVARIEGGMKVYGMAFTTRDWEPLLAGQMPQPPVYSLIDPNGGEVLYGATAHTILWRAESDAADHVLIAYSTDAGQNWHTVDTVPNTGGYRWRLPLENSDRCLVRVSDAGDANYYDLSDATFRIYTCPLTADTDFDCRIDLNDLAALAAQWLLEGP